MGSNKFILAAVAGIAGIAILNAVQKKQGITRIVAGAYILLLLLSLLSLFGGVWSQLASGLALLALVSVILADFPAQLLTNVTTGGSAPSGTVRAPTNTRGPQQ